MSLPKERLTSSNAVEWVRYRVLVRCMIEWLRSVFFFFAKSHELNITGLWAYSKFYKTICTRKAVYQKRLQSFFIVFKDYTEIWINALRVTFAMLIMHGDDFARKIGSEQVGAHYGVRGLVKNRNSVFLSHRESWCSAWSSIQELRMRITCIPRGGRQWDGWSLLLLCSAYHC